MIAELPLRKWTVEEFHRLAETELWARDYELLEGDLVRKMATGNLHIYLVNILIMWLRQAFGYQFVRQEDPLRFVETIREDGTEIEQESEPEPDAMVLTQPFFAYLERRPEPHEILLNVEVAVSSLEIDSVRKSALYARAGIVEYWIVDGEGRQIIVHRDPKPEGYSDIKIFDESQEISPLSRPEAKIRVGDLLAPKD